MSLSTVLKTIAVFCAVYYSIIALYAGIKVSGGFLWLAASAFFWVISMIVDYEKKHPGTIPLWCIVSVTTVCVTGAFVFLIVEYLIFAGIDKTATPDLDYLIVLGAKAEKNHISNSLKKRLDKALEYQFENPDTVLILSGGKSEENPFTEAELMQEYLLERGADYRHILLEDRSTSTVENIVFSKYLIDELQQAKREKRIKIMMTTGPIELVEDKPLQIGVVTNNFHVFRAAHIAEKWGIKDIHGIAADSDPILFIHLCVRECIAILKDKLMGNM